MLLKLILKLMMGLILELRLGKTLVKLVGTNKLLGLYYRSCPKYRWV